MYINTLRDRLHYLETQPYTVKVYHSADSTLVYEFGSIRAFCDKLDSVTRDFREKGEASAIVLDLLDDYSVDFFVDGIDYTAVIYSKPTRFSQFKKSLLRIIAVIL